MTQFAFSVYCTSPHLEPFHFGVLPEGVDPLWIALNANEVEVKPAQSAFVIRRQRTRESVVTWIGLYRHAASLGSARAGGFYGAGIWLSGARIEAAFAADLLGGLADEVARLAMENGAVVRPLNDVAVGFDWKYRAPDIEAAISALAPDEGLGVGDLPRLALDVSTEPDGLILAVESVQSAAEFYAYNLVYVIPDRGLIKHIRAAGRLEIVTVQEAISTGRKRIEIERLRILTEERNRASQLSAQNQSFSSQIVDLQTQNGDLRRQVQELEAEEEASRNEINASQQKLRSEVDLRKVVERQRAELEKANKRAERILAENDDRLSDLLSSESSLKADRKRLESDLAALKADRKHFEIDIATLKADRRHLENELSALKVKMKNAVAQHHPVQRRDVAELEENYQLLLHERTQLISENSALRRRSKPPAQIGVRRNWIFAGIAAALLGYGSFQGARLIFGQPDPSADSASASKSEVIHVCAEQLVDGELRKMVLTSNALVPEVAQDLFRTLCRNRNPSCREGDISYFEAKLDFKAQGGFNIGGIRDVRLPVQCPAPASLAVVGNNFRILQLKDGFEQREDELCGKDYQKCRKRCESSDDEFCRDFRRHAGIPRK